MERKNVLIFVHSPAIQFIAISNNYTQLFDQKKWTVTVVYFMGELEDSIIKKHIAEEVIFLNTPRKSARGLKWFAIRKMLALHRERQFDMVICHRYQTGYVMTCVSLFKKIPQLFIIKHAVGAMKRIGRRLFLALCCPRNTIFVGVSNAVRDDLRQSLWNIPHERIITLYNAMDTDVAEKKLLTREKSRRLLHLPDDAFVFGTIGRLDRDKNHANTIAAFSVIQSICPQSKLVIIGDGSIEAELKKQTIDLSCDKNVIFTGFLEDAFRAIKAFDVYVSSALEEAFGFALIEAMLSKVPVIATRVGGVPEVIGDTGILIDPQQSDTLAKEMLIQFNSTEEQRNQMGQKGCARVKQYFSLESFKKTFWALDSTRNNR